MSKTKIIHIKIKVNNYKNILIISLYKLIVLFYYEYLLQINMIF